MVNVTSSAVTVMVDATISVRLLIVAHMNGLNAHPPAMHAQLLVSLLKVQAVCHALVQCTRNVLSVTYHEKKSHSRSEMIDAFYKTNLNIDVFAVMVNLTTPHQKTKKQKFQQKKDHLR